MRYYRLASGSESRLAVVREGDAFDLTSASRDVTSFVDLAKTATVVDRSVDDVANRLIPRADPLEDGGLRAATVPVVPDEVWAAGVTYEISEEARKSESSLPEVYLDVYRSERPELFFKATAERTVGPNEAIGIRGDSDWNVPEPELALVMLDGDVVGYTIGNDVSSREIEGENPLYLPQAKVYDRSCSIGPCVVSAADIADPRDLDMSLAISRNGDVLYEDSTSTSEMVRSCEELVSYFTRHNAVPEISVLLTGTSLVPDDTFTLKEGDSVAIEIEGIGELRNDVVTV